LFFSACHFHHWGQYVVKLTWWSCWRHWFAFASNTASPDSASTDTSWWSVGSSDTAVDRSSVDAAANGVIFGDAQPVGRSFSTCTARQCYGQCNINCSDHSEWSDTYKCVELLKVLLLLFFYNNRQKMIELNTFITVVSLIIVTQDGVVTRREYLLMLLFV